MYLQVALKRRRCAVFSSPVALGPLEIRFGFGHNSSKFFSFEGVICPAERLKVDSNNCNSMLSTI